MTHVRVKGFKIYKDRHGKQRCYHRKTGISIDLARLAIGSAEFVAECARITALLEKSGEAKAGTLGKLMVEYKQHHAFTGLSVRTRQDYERYFQYLEPIFDIPLARFNTPLIVKIRDKASAKIGLRSGNYVKTVLSIVFSWGKERGYCESNPALEIKALKPAKDAPDVNRPWTDHERRVVFDALPEHMRLPISLMMFCGLDPQDAVKLPKNSISDGKIDVRRGKTGVGIWMPLPEPVKQEIIRANVSGTIATTICVNSFGNPWTVSGFRASWRKVKLPLEEQGLIEKGLTLKGLRHTVATILAEMGFDERTIADVLGQKTIEMARHYSRRADKSRKMENVVKEFDREVNKRGEKKV